MRCNNCGAENFNDAQFCANCGSVIQNVNQERKPKIWLIIIAVVAIIMMLCCCLVGVISMISNTKKDKEKNEDIKSYVEDYNYEDDYTEDDDYTYEDDYTDDDYTYEDDDTYEDNDTYEDDDYNNDDYDYNLQEDEEYIKVNGNNWTTMVSGEYADIEINKTSIKINETDSSVELTYDLKITNKSSDDIIVQYQNKVINDDENIHVFGSISPHIEPYGYVFEEAYLEVTKVYLEYIDLEPEELANKIDKAQFSFVVLENDTYDTLEILDGIVIENKGNNNFSVNSINTDTVNSYNDTDSSSTNSSSDTFTGGFEGYVTMELDKKYWSKFVDVDVDHEKLKSQNVYLAQYSSKDMEYVITISKTDSQTSDDVAEIVASNMVKSYENEGAKVLKAENSVENGMYVYRMLAQYPNNELIGGYVIQKGTKVVQVLLETRGNTTADEYSETFNKLIETMTLFGSVIR